MFSEILIEILFHPILEELHNNRDRILEYSIPIELEVKEHYQRNLSLGRGLDNQALDNGLYNSVINCFQRWSYFEVSKGHQPGFNMLEHYTTGAKTRYLHLIFVNIMLPVRTSDRDGSLGSPGVWHKTDKGEVYNRVSRTSEGEIYIPMSWCIDRGKGDIYRY